MTSYYAAMQDASVPSSSNSSFWEHEVGTTSTHATSIEHSADELKAPLEGDEIIKRLTGAWSLQSVQAVSSNGTIYQKPLGSSPSGLLLYAPDGYTTASIEASDDAGDHVPANFIYSGPFELTHPAAAFMDCGGRQPDAIIHSLVESALGNEDVGTILVRELTLHGQGKDSYLTHRTTDTKPLGPNVSGIVVQHQVVHLLNILHLCRTRPLACS